MAPLNVTGDVVSPLIRHFNNHPAANNADTNLRDSILPDYSQPKMSPPKITVIVFGGLILAIICVCLFYRIFCNTTKRPETPMPQGHVYGHDNASSHGLGTLRPDRSYERPSFQHVENSGLGDSPWGGNTVARPAPAATHGWDRGDATPPPPCK